MLPDDWKGWQQCTDECLYVRLGLDPGQASSYGSAQIEAAYEERKIWWMKKPRSNPRWSERIRSAEAALAEAKLTLCDPAKKQAYDLTLKDKPPPPPPPEPKPVPESIQKARKLTNRATIFAGSTSGVAALALMAIGRFNGTDFLLLVFAAVLGIVSLGLFQSKNTGCAILLLIPAALIMLGLLYQPQVLLILLPIPVTWFVCRAIFRNNPERKGMATLVPLGVCSFCYLAAFFLLFPINVEGGFRPTLRLPTFNLPSVPSATRPATAAGAPTPTAVPLTGTKMVYAKAALVMSAPTNGKQVATVKRGERVDVLEQQGFSCKVRTKGGKTGWIMQSALEYKSGAGR